MLKANWKAGALGFSWALAEDVEELMRPGLPSGLVPNGLGPSGLGPSGLGLSGLGLSGRAPSGQGPSGQGPSGLAPGRFTGFSWADFLLGLPSTTSRFTHVPTGISLQLELRLLSSRRLQDFSALHIAIRAAL